MENTHALKLIKKVQSDLIANGLVVEDFVTDLKKLREFALLEQNPILVKAIRLTYEHVLKNEAFLIDIPLDEPIDEENDVQTEKVVITENNMESLQYILSLFTDLNNKHNIADLKEYNLKLQQA